MLCVWTARFRIPTPSQRQQQEIYHRLEKDGQRLLGIVETPTTKRGLYFFFFFFFFSVKRKGGDTETGSEEDQFPSYLSLLLPSRQDERILSVDERRKERKKERSG